MSLKQLRLPGSAHFSPWIWLQTWGKHARECLPPWLRHWLAQRQPPLLIVNPRHTEAALSREHDGERHFLTALDINTDSALSALVPRPRKGWRETVIELATDEILIRSVIFPAQVRDNLRQVVSYELDRLTPFQAHDVYFDVLPTDIVARGTRIQALIALCRRDHIQPWIERLRQIGSAPARLTWQGAWENANLLPIDQRPRRRYLGLLVNVSLLLIVIALIAAVMISPLWQKNHELEQLNRVLRSVRIEAEQVPAMREELERARAGSVAVLERKAAQPRMIDLLLELTDRLPDDTWIQTINFRGDEVDLRGESGQATELLNLLEQAPGMSNVSFRSPVMQISQTGKERFHISFRYQRPTA